MKRFILLAFLALTLPVVAQSKNAKAQLNVEGICNSCKARIEKAALGVKGVKYAQECKFTPAISYLRQEKNLYSTSTRGNRQGWSLQ